MNIFFIGFLSLGTTLKRSVAISTKLSSCSDLLGNRPLTKKDIFTPIVKIRGSHAYNRKMFTDLMSMVVSLGAHACFLTLSANDLGWDDLGALLLKTSTCTKYQK